MMARTSVPSKGWCPGALRPMHSGDGLIVRIKPRSGAISIDALLAIADASQRCGNGNVDVTRRANLQIRGVREETLPELYDLLSPHDVLDRTAQAEAVRNLVLSPLSGADPSEILDMRPLARTLEQALSNDTELWQLPAKFGFVLDGGGQFPLDQVHADIRLTAMLADDAPVVELAIDGRSGPKSVGHVSASQAPQAAVAIAKASMRVQSPGQWLRMRDLSITVLPEVIGAISGLTVPFAGSAPERSRMTWLGVQRLPDGRVAIGFASPFGRWNASTLRDAALAAAAAGCADVRPAPTRAFHVVTPSVSQANVLLSHVENHGLIVDANDPLLSIEACPGAPDCASGTLGTRDVARAVAAMRALLRGVESIHISGCPKGCARSLPADLVLAAHGDRFAVIRHGRADADSQVLIAPCDIDNLPHLLTEVNSDVR